MKKSKLSKVKSDSEPMTLLNKGEILYLDKQGFTMKDIAGITKRSMEWVSIIIGALTGCDIYNKLIEDWEEELHNGKNKDNDRQVQSSNTTRKKHGISRPNARNKVRRKSNNSLRVQRTITGISAHSTGKYSNSTRRSRNGNTSKNSKSDGKGLKEGLERHIDNKRG